MFDISFVSHACAALGFAALAAILIGQWQVKPLGPSLICACLGTVLWAGTVAAGTQLDYPPVALINATELVRDATWLYFLLQIAGLQSTGSHNQLLGKPWLGWFLAALGLGALVVALRPMREVSSWISPEFALSATLTMWLLLSIAGLILLEQIYRNASSTAKWGLKYLCLGLGILFIYDFFMYAEALLFSELTPELWQARGLVNTMVVPCLAVAISRNRDWNMDVYVSRQVVFHTVTLLGSGLYLVGMALAGYAIKYLGGDWGGVLQVSFFAGSCVLLGGLLFSASLRARLRVYLSKNFFRNRYDYREEWLKFTEGLAAIEGDLGVGIIENLAPIVHSEGGILYTREAGGSLSRSASWQLNPSSDGPTRDEWILLRDWLEDTGWVIDLAEWRARPQTYNNLQIPVSISSAADYWLLVPLLFQASLEGIIILRKTGLKSSVMWEDRDLLKTAGRQAASYLAQDRASGALVEARQFDAFNRLSAYVVHDLKNILAQQSLLVTNAQKHRDNPAFVDDMISTVDNSVNRMQKLMEQMRSGMRNPVAGILDISQVMREVVAQRAAVKPQPELHLPDGEIYISADPERLATVFAHLVQNAQESTEAAATARVLIDVSKKGDVASVSISDTGVGMSADFIRDRLFKPFDSTKGLTGMGIGAFEARDYLRQLGGEVSVSSTVGEGSVFTVTLPVTVMESDHTGGYDTGLAR
ncbi:MAG: XrtA/PEP-CTERM system histidine kinase PrsK [Congregibacter sp.]